MTFLLLVICILSSGFTGNIYKKLSDDCRRSYEIAATPSVWLLWLSLFFAVFSLVSKSNRMISLELLLTAIPAGVCIFVAAYTLLLSMKENALSVAVIIVNLNFIIPVVLSLIFLSEHIGIIQLLGMILSITVIVLLNIGGKSEGETKKSGILLPVAACLSNGLFNFFIKINESQGGAAFPFFAVAYGFGACISIVVGTVLSIRKGKIRFPLEKTYLKKAILPMLLIGICNGVCFYTARILAERMNAAAQFTAVTCMSILLSLVVGFLFQGDKFNKKTFVSILFCVLAVLCQYSGLV